MQKKGSIKDNLNSFIRKYYKNRMIKGAIYSLALLLSLFLVVALLECFGYFGTAIRAILFWFYLVGALAVLFFFVFQPLAKMFRLGKTISYEQAARIIGDFFPEVQDKLLNLLQLQEQHQHVDDELLLAAINQRVAQLSPIPFHLAVNIKANRKYLKFALIPLTAILLLLVLSPTLLTQPIKRITHYHTYFQRPAPFSFHIENVSLRVPQQDDFTLRVSVAGKAIPSETFVNIEGTIYRMTAVDKTHFVYTFHTLQRSTNFHLEAIGVHSPEYQIEVVPKPAIVNFSTTLTYPSYTGKKGETLDNEGDVDVPRGTSVKWIFNTHDVDTIFFFLNDKVQILIPDASGRVSFSVKAMTSFTYGFCAANAVAPRSDTLRYAVSTIDDAFPMIAVLQLSDSLYPDRLFFQGRIKDDYGFTKLEFKVVKSNVNDTSVKETLSYPIALTHNTVQEFNHSFNLAGHILVPGDKLSYYFVVWDNDAIAGPKSSTSQQFEIAIPSEKELDDILDRNSNEAQQHAQQSVSEIRKLQQDINELMRKMVDKKELNWQDKKDMQELAKKQQQVKNLLQQMQQQLQQNKQLEQRYKDQSDKLLEKQHELEKLMDEVMNEEMKQMMQQIDEMMKEVDKNKVQEQLEKLKLDNEQIEKQLDQNIALMKRLEMEKKVEDAISMVNQMAEKQKQLSKQSQQATNKEQKQRLLEQQEQLSQQFDQLQQQLHDIQKEYKQLDPSLDFKVDQKLLQQIDRQQQNSEDNLRKNHGKEASQQQQDAAENMEKLAEQLAQSQVDMEQQDLAEDAEMIRHLLKNLVKLSFNQESLIGSVRQTYVQDPKYQQIISQQNKVKDDFRAVEDTLRAVAKRQMTVASVINKNVADINDYLHKSLSALLDMNQSFYGGYKNQKAPQPMQYAMTSFNNLALVMAESLDQMQNQMRQNQQNKKNGQCNQQSKKRQGSCSKPGKGKPSPKSMKQMQQELNKQMEALKKQLDKQGKKPDGRKKIGDKGQSQMSEEFAKMAAQQEMIRRMMQQYGQQMKQDNAGNSKLAKEIDQMLKQMEQTETELVNRVITQQTIRRQQQIMTRMLEHEKAEMQREKEERRESNEGKEQYHQPSQSELEKYQKLKEANKDLFRSTPPTLSPYYKNKVDAYFFQF